MSVAKTIFKQLKSKRKKLLKISHELKTADLSDIIGQKAKLTKTCVDWYEKYCDSVGIPYEEMKVIAKKPTGTITEAKYCSEDGFIFKIVFDTFDIRVGIEDIKVL